MILAFSANDRVSAGESFGFLKLGGLSLKMPLDILTPFIVAFPPTVSFVLSCYEVKASTLYTAPMFLAVLFHIVLSHELTVNLTVYLNSSLTSTHPVLLPPNGNLLNAGSRQIPFHLGRNCVPFFPKILTFSSAYILPGVISFIFQSCAIKAKSLRGGDSRVHLP